MRQHKQDISPGPTSRPRALNRVRPVRHPGRLDAGQICGWHSLIHDRPGRRTLPRRRASGGTSCRECPLRQSRRFSGKSRVRDCAGFSSWLSCRAFRSACCRRSCQELRLDDRVNPRRSASRSIVLSNPAAREMFACTARPRSTKRGSQRFNLAQCTHRICNRDLGRACATRDNPEQSRVGVHDPRGGAAADRVLKVWP